MNDKTISYRALLDEYFAHPRDVCTVPLDHREPKWFYVYAEFGNLYVEVARTHGNSSSLKKRALLKEAQFDAMLDIYRRRLAGEPVSREAESVTFQQVYWYGVFSDMGY